MRNPALLLALLAGAVLSAQQPSQPVFRSGVELVTVDVVATTGGGDPVHNLKAADFELFEDDVRQEIRTFEFINFSTPPPELVLPPDVFTNATEPGGIFTVVLDEIGYQVDDIGIVRRVAERFFKESLQPNDHVAVIRSGATSGFFLTADRSMALEAITAATGRRERTLGITEPGSPDAPMAESTPSIETFGSGENGRNSFRVLASVVDQLRLIRARRKAILWFSRGGDLPPNILESFELQRQVGRDDDAFIRLVQSARAANVAIYSIDPRGLQSGASVLNRDIMPMDVTALRDVAGFTGGRTVLGNDPNAVLTKIAAENRAYYLLGYEPAPVADKRQRARKLRVTTRAPGVSLLHRSVFMPGSEKKGATPALIASPLPVRDLVVMLAPAPVALDRRKRGLLVPFEIGGDLRDGTEVEYNVVALDPTGKVVSRAAGRGKARNGRVVGEVGLAVESKPYQVRLAAHAANPDLNGLTFATVRVPEGESKEPVCGNFVFEQSGPREGLRTFSRATPLTISALVSAEKLTGALAFGLGPAGGIPQKVWPVALGTPLAKGLWRVALNLNSLPGGSLEIQLLQDGLLLNDNCLTRFSTR